MKPVTINASAVIRKGILKDVSGRVIGFDCINDEVALKIDNYTSVLISSENIVQGRE